MVTALDLVEPKIREATQGLRKTSISEHAASLEALPSDMLKSIKEGTLTLKEIDLFLHSRLKVPPQLQEYLLAEKAWLLLRGGQGEQALHFYDEALEIIPNTASTWARKGAALLELNQIEEAFQAFERAYSLRQNFGAQREGYLRDLFTGWSLAAVSLSLGGIAEQDTARAAQGVKEYLSVKAKAEAEKMPEAATVILEAEEQAEPGITKDIEEWNLMVKLLSIIDPFEGFRAMSKEISKHWPKGLSAVDAVREQRDREWNT